VKPVTAQREKRKLSDNDDEKEKWPTANPNEFLNIANNVLISLFGLAFSKNRDGM
jgi:hypothetical protein